ncbi:AraC family transcriptional regulator [Henriciella litoralis]|uniref:AraC family transcriptional regulator n=1 Tax=Henriciella litoralis TaxID=568102 RepID=UPI000A0431F0|nr:helix-turn-helix domain-containing protein [Henriciella litoralis]
MQFEYFRPDATVRDLIGSYYRTTVTDHLVDVMRAEIANIRFILSGGVTSDIGGTPVFYGPGSAILCGPTFKWSRVEFQPNTILIGAAITPLGWARMFDIPANDLADNIRPLKDCIPEALHAHLDAVFDSANDGKRVQMADELFAALDHPHKKINQDFLDKVTAWITDPEPNELEDLMASVNLSPRQVERLSKQYFGSAPKKLHRKFRALHSANRLTWQELTDWRDVATTAYFDQSHFIREFRLFNGRTPSEFINGAHLLVRHTLTERRQIEHHSPYSLVG